ncbi:MAG: hypothetical protein ACI93R_001368 [Flavobacteriales bacterium]|jgi:hypothetical protein
MRQSYRSYRDGKSQLSIMTIGLSDIMERKIGALLSTSSPRDTEYKFSFDDNKNNHSCSLLIINAKNHIDVNLTGKSTLQYGYCIVVLESQSDVEEYSNIIVKEDDILMVGASELDIHMRINLAVLKCQYKLLSSSIELLRMDDNKLLSYFESKGITFTSSEFILIRTLIKSEGEIISKKHLTENALQRDLMGNDRRIDVHISRIRQKLKKSLGNRLEISSVRGRGYKICQTDDNTSS